MMAQGKRFIGERYEGLLFGLKMENLDNGTSKERNIFSFFYIDNVINTREN